MGEHKPIYDAQISISGFLGAAAEFDDITTRSGEVKRAMKFDVAVRQPESNQTGPVPTVWFKITCWQARLFSHQPYLIKGVNVKVDGYLKVRNYKTSAGQDRQVLNVYAQGISYHSPPNIVGSRYRSTQPQRSS